MEIGPYLPRFCTPTLYRASDKLEGRAKLENHDFQNCWLEHPRSDSGDALQAWVQGWVQEGSRICHCQGGKPEVAKKQVLAQQEVREPWLMMILRTKSSTKDSIIYQKLAAGERNFLSSHLSPVLTLIWNRQLER